MNASLRDEGGQKEHLFAPETVFATPPLSAPHRASSPTKVGGAHRVRTPRWMEAHVARLAGVRSLKKMNGTETNRRDFSSRHLRLQHAAASCFPTVSFVPH
jgi:hypothetical protein